MNICFALGVKEKFVCDSSRAQCEKAFKLRVRGGVDLVAMDDISMLITYAHSDWLIVSVRDSFIEVL